MELKDWVRLARKHKGWTLAQMAEAMGRSKSNIGLWEQGKHSPGYDQVVQIAAETGFPLPHQVELDEKGRPVAIPRVGEGFLGSVSVHGEATINGSVFAWDMKGLSGSLRGLNAPGAFAIRIKGEGGSPVVKHHQFLVIVEEGRPGFGELCLVDSESQPTQLLEFLAEQGSSWTFSTLQHERVTIDKQDILKVWPVIAVASQSLWYPDSIEMLKLQEKISSFT
ncbi:helix-turn-helix domain-containing protein [Paracidovorax konjaci]|uniref:Helix-turn-helix domain-containing protein n=1 Tax=Paracidovorax konjaci TaxID=32040 RepID=A0A1I1YMT5_9BURK|nr:helix-turn-helix transcriptional regulator [Paracidovorax konjaci]SFE19463.1 Helix-turn-helix domain-containing protein [Paracidovorax konjaci]